jgi:hypothetical protein
MNKVQLPCGHKLESQDDPTSGLSLHLAIDTVCGHCSSRLRCYPYKRWLLDNHRGLSEIVVRCLS